MHQIKLLQQQISDEDLNKQVQSITAPINTDEMAKLLEEKQTQIDDLTSHNQFTQEELKDKTKYAEELSNQLKDQKSMNAAAARKETELSQKLVAAEKERDKAVNCNEASRYEVSQLVCLNQQLKTTNDKLNEKLKGLDQTSIKQNVERKNGDSSNQTNAPQSLDAVVIAQRLCYNEMKEVGSCPWGKERCRFNHVIPQEVLQDKEQVRCIIGGKNLCVNEFRKKGSCIKGQQCRFNHEITSEQINNPVMQDIMKKKAERMKIQTEGTPKRQNARLCVHEFQQMGSCTWKERCKFSHDINEEQRNNADLQNQMKSVKIQHPRNHHRQGENVVVPRNMLEEIWTKLESLSQSTRF